MGNTNEELDLTSPEFIPVLTEEQINAAGEKKKYLDGGIYYLRTTGVKINYTKPTLKNGELNLDAKGAIWLELELTTVRKDGSIATKLKPIPYVRVFLYERLTPAAMKAVGYTEEQLAKVSAMTLPDTFEMFRGFAKAVYPDRFGSYPRFDKDSKTWTYQGTVVTDAQAKEIKDTEKNKVVAFQREVRSTNGKNVQGKDAFWKVVFDEKDGPAGKEKNPWPSAIFPSATPHRDKTGTILPVADPDKDFA